MNAKNQAIQPIKLLTAFYLGLITKDILQSNASHILESVLIRGEALPFLIASRVDLAIPDILDNWFKLKPSSSCLRKTESVKKLSPIFILAKFW